MGYALLGIGAVLLGIGIGQWVRQVRFRRSENWYEDGQIRW